jgi:capsular exopolysaccharide synthesis family protein
MTRLHAALNRATDGKAPILPAGVETTSGDGTDGLQPGFSVPWTLDGGANAAPGNRSDADTAAIVSAAAPETWKGFISLAMQPAELSPSGDGEKLVGKTDSAGQETLAAAAEQYRKLVATLLHAQADRPLKVLMVTSANPGEGKSLTASNLALTLSESYQRRVLLIDGDLRRPSLHDVFGVPNRAGLSDGLTRKSIQEIAVRELSARLSILPSGRAVEDPTGELTSDQMRQVLEEARARYDWVVIDTPPIGLVSDAKLISEMVDGVVLVVEAAKSAYPGLVRAIESIGRKRILGVVLNRLQHASGRNYYYSSYYRRSKAPEA